ncbi:protein-glutamate O-methyltransferase CheR [Rossellomorea marisflavi]|uniref:CheR family methyltransferase n=1 Tax=Rossellomorea marisflavi TaxID=189381 RepID=UPI00296EBB4F|nr:protein-glutamate O-methyltransferase CheR [Rossellomorea marisflavi]MDW4527155.1 protein-glutamate O-methyltransferase CheR [Rossellomorea marisflavi]
MEFIQSVKRKTNIDLSLYKEAQMKRRLTALYEKKGCHGFKEYFNLIKNDREQMEEFLDRMTINVSEFFRNQKRWEVLEESVLPRLMKGTKLRVWSAACSTGEEPYTIAMILLKHLKPEQFTIIATDLDKNALQRARTAVYPERSLQEIPELLKKKYFVKDGTRYTLDRRIVECVTFKQQNLLADPFDSHVDLIICRNVLIYFTEEAKTSLYRKFNEALSPGGFLFVGSTEQIFTPSQYGFQSEETFFYRKSNVTG